MSLFSTHQNIKILFETLYSGSRYPINNLKNIAAKLGGTTIYNCGISFDQKHYTFAIRANNLSNKLYYGYVVTTNQETPKRNGYYPAAGFNLLATLELKL